MNCHFSSWHLKVAIAGIVLASLLTSVCANAQEQRARPPVFDENATSRVFFSDLSTAFRGERPSLANLRKLDAVAADVQSDATTEGESGGEQLWNKLVSPISLEDEVKRVKLKFDASITTPGAFNGGGYQEARLHLSVLASLFAVISEYPGDVRWKSDSQAARDLTARTAQNCAAGSTVGFKEAQLRKADLQDLISGSGLSGAKGDSGPNDWSMIADRSPLMEYAQILLDNLSGHATDAATVQENVDSVRRHSELIAMLGEILVHEGMDDAEDEDYQSMSRAMTKASRSIVAAIERQDFEAARAGVGAITQSCADCHEQYR